MSVIVVGGGPAGMIAAIAASEKRERVILIEKNEKLGKKLYITGKGRCNLTNNCEVGDIFGYIQSNPKFLTSAIYYFPPKSTINYFEGAGLQLKEERGGRVFPHSDKSSDVIATLEKKLEANKVEVLLNEAVVGFELSANKKKIVGVVTNKGKYPCKSVVLATGGMSYPLTGSTGDGYKLAENVGHTIVDPKPSLCPIILNNAKNVENEYILLENLNYPVGLSLKNVVASIKDRTKEKYLFKEFGEMLFTDMGVSGPIILTLSTLINRMNFNNLELVIDLKPALTYEQLNKRILRDFSENLNKQLKNSLFDLLPSSIISHVIAMTGIDPMTPVNAVTKTDRMNLIRTIKNLTFGIRGLSSFNHAVVTSGGISTKEIDPSSMRSKKVENLFFAGEIIDVDAKTGGFNIQIALSTGYLAGKSQIL